MDVEDHDRLKIRLAEMQTEHRDLDDVIAQIGGQGPFDQLQVQRLKKRKLLLRDQIERIRSKLIPDEIA